MYRRPKFLEILLDIRQRMAREADFDTDLFAELIRHGTSVAAAAEPASAGLPDDSENSGGGRSRRKINHRPGRED